MTKEEIFSKLATDKKKWYAYEGDLKIFTKEEVLEAMDEYAKQQAIAFQKWYAVKMIEFLQYFKRKLENPIIYSIPDAYDKYIEEFEGKTQDERYNLFIEQSKR